MPVELGREEAGPPHLAVADDVDAGLLLVAQRQVDRIVEHLLEVDRAEPAPFGFGDPGHEPGRPRMRADDTRAKDLGHPSPPSIVANANARAGFVTNRPARTVASIPPASIVALKPSSSQPSPGDPPYTA